MFVTLALFALDRRKGCVVRVDGRVNPQYAVSQGRNAKIKCGTQLQSKTLYTVNQQVREVNQVLISQV